MGYSPHGAEHSAHSRQRPGFYQPPFIYSWLAGCGRLRIFITSRERVGVTGEQLRSVSGLAVPAPGIADPVALEDIDAVRLFVDRATGVDPGFRLTGATVEAVAQICRCLDGLPLAIELAAANLNTLGVDEVADRLDDRFRLLTRGGRTALARHQTLRAAVDWSYDMLSAEQRRLFNRIAVFVGGCTLAAIEAVCGDDTGDDTLSLLSHLVDASLVGAQTEAEPTRYRMLETLRTYGLERLDECGETALLRDRHAAHVLALAQEADASLRGSEQPRWLQRLETEHGNIRAALAWSHERGDAATAIGIAGLLQPLWDRHGHYTEGRGWLKRVLLMSGPVPVRVRARALDSAAGLAVVQGDLEQAEAAGWQAAALCERAEDIAGIARALQHVGLAAIYADDLDRAAAILQTSLRHARAVGDGWLQAWSLLFLATAALARAEYPQTIELLTECETCLGTNGDPECLGWALVIRAVAAWREGDHRDAMKVLAGGIDAFQGLGHRWGLSVALLVASWLAGADGDDTRMVLLLAASERVRDSVGAAVLSFVRPWIDEAVARAQTGLDTEQFDRAWRTGQTLTLDAALLLALQEVLP